MIILVKRPKIEQTDFTLSPVYIDSNYFCHVLEDTDRGLHSEDDLSYIKSVKVKHSTAIPYGTYEVVISYSNRFKRMLPLLLNVKGFEGIRIHSGNTHLDTSGCLLPGIPVADKVTFSTSTFQSLFTLIKKTIRKEKVYVTIQPHDT
jgi:hypothetical protein